MHILLLGRSSIVTKTVHRMLVSVEGWKTTFRSSWKNLDTKIKEKNTQKPLFDILIVNLSDFSDSPVNIIRNLIAQFPSVPLLVLNSYEQQLLINPLIEAGATGYLQTGISENELLTAVEVVAQGEKYFATENTY